MFTFQSMFTYCRLTPSHWQLSHIAQDGIRTQAIINKKCPRFARIYGSERWWAVSGGALDRSAMYCKTCTIDHLLWMTTLRCPQLPSLFPVYFALIERPLAWSNQRPWDLIPNSKWPLIRWPLACLDALPIGKGTMKWWNNLYFSELLKI